MSDLNYIDRTQEVKIAGQDATGLGVNYVGADANGNMLVKDYSDGPVTPGTVASASALIGGQFNTALPTLTNTQQSAIQLDSSGRIIIRPLTSADIVSAVQSGTWNITNISGTISLPTGASTSALQTTGNTSVTTIATNTTNLTVAQGSTTSRQTGQIRARCSYYQSSSLYYWSNRSFLSSITGDLRSVDIVNTAGQYRAQSVTTTAAEALGAATILANRKSYHYPD